MNKYVKITLCAVFGISVITVLFLISSHRATEKNGFQRLFGLYPLRAAHRLDVKYNSYYIAGISSKRIYLGNITAPFYMISSSFNLKDTTNVQMKVEKDKAVNWGAVKIYLDSPNVYMTEQITPSVVTSNTIFDRQKTYSLKGFKYSISQMLSPGSIVVKYYDDKLKTGFLEKIMLSPQVKKDSRFQLTKQNGSNFSFDGFFTYSPKKNILIYTYYYRNRFICLDTNMNLLYEGKTIDTNNLAKIKSVEIKSAKKIERLLSAPPLQVNKKSYIDGGLLYVYAALVSDVESTEEFKKYSVIDVYDLNKKGKYHHSIKVPNQNGQRIRGFAVYKDKIFALYEHWLYTYRI
jgi:hypothetical protein